MSLITGQEGIVDEHEAMELLPDPLVTARQTVTVFRRRSVRPSRRAVLHLRSVDDAPVPTDLASWYNERGFHFYVALLRWPGRAPVAARWPGRALAATFADLDSACTRLRRVDGIDTLIVSAHGEAALAAALWCDARRRSVPVDALLLYAPVFGWKLRRGLDITCPVLVLAGGGEEVTRVRGRHRASGFRRRAGGVGKLGPHVTWLRLPDGGASPCARDRRRFFDEMGRWLGAYMYRQMRDQLL